MAETKFKETEVGLIPEGWEVKPLGEVAHIHKGIQFNKADMNTAGSYPVINGGIDASGYIEQYNCDKDTITVSQGGASAGYVNWLSQKFWAGAHCYVVKPNEGTNNKYLYYFLKFNELAFMNSKYGGNIPALAINTLLNFFVPIPPQEEQERIAGALSSVDELIASLDRQIAKTRDIRQGVTQNLLKGKVDVRKTVGEVCEIKRGVVISEEYVRNHQGGYPVYSSQTENNGEFGRISTYMYDGEYVTWTTDGYAGSVFYRRGKFNITNVCGLLKVKDPTILTTKYLCYILQVTAKAYVNWDLSNPKLMSNVMATISIPIPPLAEQKHIASVLTSFDDTIEGLEAKRQKYESIKAGMMQQLLTGTIRLS